MDLFFQQSSDHPGACRGHILTRQKASSSVFNLPVEPGAGAGPDPLDRTEREAKSLRRLRHREAREIPKLNQLVRGTIRSGEFRYGAPGCGKSLRTTKGKQTSSLPNMIFSNFVRS
jgi:hypothetical protein